MKLVSSISRRRDFLISSAASALALKFSRVLGNLGQLLSPEVVKASGEATSTGKKPLKAVVVYYSASGNTGRIAGAIYRGMRSVIPCDIAPIEKMDPRQLTNYDLIAIGGPVWHFRESANLRLYAYKMPQLKDKLAILFCTHGANPDSLFYGVGSFLTKKQLTVIGWNDWYGKSRISLHSPQPDPTGGHPDEIDLKEAENFGREMADRAQKIYAGERNLVPEIPAGPDADSLWQPRNGATQTQTVGGATKLDPVIDTTRCVYPRCTSCIDNCVANAIDLSVIGTAAGVSSASLLVHGCLHCSPAYCIRSCAYDAISYEQSQQIHAIDMKKCTYPKCTLCVDHCPMHVIDFSQNPPIFHKSCEGCDVCYALCPTRALEITNMAETHGRMSQPCDPKHPTAGCHGVGVVNGKVVYQGFYSRLNEAAEKGKFRPLVPIERVGWNTELSTFTNVPLLVRDDADWPYHVS